MANGHKYGAGLILFGFFIFGVSVSIAIGPIKGYLIGSVGLLFTAGGLTLIMNEEDVDKKWIGYVWLGILTIVGLLLGINYFGISIAPLPVSG